MWWKARAPLLTTGVSVEKRAPNRPDECCGFGRTSSQPKWATTKSRTITAGAEYIVSADCLSVAVKIDRGAPQNVVQSTGHASYRTGSRREAKMPKVRDLTPVVDLTRERGTGPTRKP